MNHYEIQCELPDHKVLQADADARYKVLLTTIQAGFRTVLATRTKVSER